MSRVLDLGSGRSLRIVAYEGRVFGGILEHHRPDGSPCACMVYWLEGWLPTWTVVRWDPLTLSPSIACTLCPEHGFIQDGRWI